MIHQLIFADAKPGMTVEEFQRYWVEVHAVRYASKIHQIKKYLIDTTVPFNDEIPLWNGVAEIWLENDEEQLASLQSEEFLQGARLDEPNWAAFWKTVVIDTDAHLVLEGPALSNNPTWIKLLILHKRKEGMHLDNFRKYFLNTHGLNVLKLPRLRRYMQCHTRDGYYTIGESRFDGASQLWFDDVQSLRNALNSPEYKNLVEPDMEQFLEMKYNFSLVVKEHWIIGPGKR
ncbi:MAG: EthD domain-containing protein [Bacteroidota bacterium]